MADIDPNINKEILKKRLTVRRMEVEIVLERMELRQMECAEEAKRIDREIVGVREDLDKVISDLKLLSQ